MLIEVYGDAVTGYYTLIELNIACIRSFNVYCWTFIDRTDDDLFAKLYIVWELPFNLNGWWGLGCNLKRAGQELWVKIKITENIKKICTQKKAGCQLIWNKSDSTNKKKAGPNRVKHINAGQRFQLKKSRTTIFILATSRLPIEIKWS